MSLFISILLSVLVPVIGNSVTFDLFHSARANFFKRTYTQIRSPQISKSKMMTGTDNNSASAEQILDLSSKINKAECYYRNECAQYPMSNLFLGDSRLGCKSDADEQLIIHIAFQEFVKVRKFIMRFPLFLFNVNSAILNGRD